MNYCYASYGVGYEDAVDCDLPRDHEGPHHFEVVWEQDPPPPPHTCDEACPESHILTREALENYNPHLISILFSSKPFIFQGREITE
jgi:hypothetical protein